MTPRERSLLLALRFARPSGLDKRQLALASDFRAVAGSYSGGKGEVAARALAMAVHAAVEALLPGAVVRSKSVLHPPGDRSGHLGCLAITPAGERASTGEPLLLATAGRVCPLRRLDPSRHRHYPLEFHEYGTYAELSAAGTVRRLAEGLLLVVQVAVGEELRARESSAGDGLGEDQES